MVCIRHLFLAPYLGGPVRRQRSGLVGIIDIDIIDIIDIRMQLRHHSNAQS